MKARCSFFLACLVGVCLATPKAGAAAPQKASGEALLSQLAAIDFGDVYVEDGAADGSVTEEWRMSESGPEAAAFAKIREAADLREAAIPFLIAHLDDARPARTLFNGKPVLAGHIALDILSHIVGQNRIVFDVDCADDGLGACFNAGYYYRPDAHLVEMKVVKAKWRRLYRRHKIQYTNPLLW